MPINLVTQEAEELNSLISQNQNLIQPSQQSAQGQEELDQVAFELANKLSKGQLKLKELQLEPTNTEEISAI